MAKKFYKAVWSTPTTDYEKGPDSVGPMVDRLAQAGFDLIIPVVKGATGTSTTTARSRRFDLSLPTRIPWLY